ncbi:hypothetical protein JCM8097_005911 [Rhodosporidiobolus ruineniae]
MILRSIFAPDRPAFLKSRRPSATPLLPSLANSVATSANRGNKSRVLKVVAGLAVLYWVVQVAHWAAPHKVVKPASLLASLQADTCEARGLATPLASEEERHRVVLRLRPNPAGESRARNPDNTILTQSLHPSLDSARLFDPSFTAIPSDLARAQQCIVPQTHYLPLNLPLVPSPQDPELFFSVSTNPARALASAPIWRHFMRAPSDDIAAPGCLVTDAQGRGDGDGMAKANAEFAAQGLSCVMQDSSRSDDRYEMRVLYLLRDAWQESERRRWQDGKNLVEWFVFQDDDTFFTDPQMLKALLSGYDWRDEHFFGSFSEAVPNFEAFGKIAYGGGGMIMSRSLVRKMQTMLDKCAERFSDTFGGDGLISKCAAWTRDLPLDQVVEEVPAMRQMDLKGDASGYLQAGTAPFLTLHHWSGWLDLFPSLPSASSIQLLASAASAVGGPNFLRRWIFDDGAVTLTLGYAITVHREKLGPEELRKTEWTWDGHEPRRASRPKLEEGTEKLTYYLTSVDRLSPDVALLRHTCTHPSVRSSLRQIDILWDLRTSRPSWSDRLRQRLWLSEEKEKSGPRRRVQQVLEAQERERIGEEVRERDEEMKGKRKGRVVEFSG